MKIREQKRLLIYLEMLLDIMSQQEHKEIHAKVSQHLTQDDLIKIIHWLFPKTWSIEILSLKSKDELLGLIGAERNILLHMITMIEESMTNIVRYTQSEVTTFFRKNQNELHYLANKPVEDWVAYDRSNYHSLLLKTNSTKKVYGIFTSDVLAEDVYAVTTKPSFFFDSREEAEAEIQKIVSERKFKSEELTVHKLWLIQN